MRGGQIVAPIRSEILHLKVCGPCADEAGELGLQVEALDDLPLGRRRGFTARLKGN